MKRFFKSIIACICGLTIVFSSAVSPAFARDGVIGSVVDGVQSFTEWGVNNLNEFWKIIFGPDFNSASEEELKAAYDSYVETLPASSVTSEGVLYVNSAHYYTVVDIKYSSAIRNCYCQHYDDAASSNTFTAPYHSLTEKSDYSVSCSLLDASRACPVRAKYYFALNAPIAGYYKRISSPSYNVVYTRFSTSSSSLPSETDTRSWTASSTGTYRDKGYLIVDNETTFSRDLSVSIRLFNSTCSPPIYEVTPYTPIDFSADSIYNTTTRPTSITGGNYGIVGDNGQITRVEDNSTIVNETNNTYYNPATGATVPITGWTYDYSDRSYKVTMEGGKTSTVTYGDENISITETTVNESGDTITNNYTIYYLVNGSGFENPPCEHDWQESSSTDPTCTFPGKVTLSCTKCQQTKTESIPALGHNWQVKQTVTTQYDEEGNLTQQGYTIFECSRCHEQYKSIDGTAPPGGGSGTDPGGEEGETTIGGLIEKLLSGVGSIVGGIIKGLLSLLTKAVEALAGLAELFTTFVGSLVELWGGFTSFLSAVFPFLPEEFVIIIELGLILMIAAAVFRKFIS